MQPLTLDDLVPVADYIGRRPEFFAAHSKYIDRYRRVRVGPRLTLVFENRQTLWFRIQELLRVARLTDPKRVQIELDAYNRLLPARETLNAALIIDVPDGPDWASQMQSWQDLSGEHLRLIVGHATAPAHLVTCRPEDRCAGTAHWLTFAISQAMRAALVNNRQSAVVAANVETYQHRSPPMGELIRRSLLDDLELSDRDIAKSLAA
jgi:Protein of unknown function (DUF3501)